MSLKVLVVEDDRLLAEVISDYFTSKEWEVVVASDGTTALEIVREQSFQLILLDVMLPKQNGFTVFRKIRETSDVPIFFITARVMEEDELPHIFDMFYTSDKSRNFSEKHMGLGLYLAKKILELHKMSISIGNTEKGVEVIINR